MVGTINTAGPMVPAETADSEVEPIADFEAMLADGLLEDAQWAMREWEANRTSPKEGQETGNFVAVYKLELLGYGDDSNRLQSEWAKAKGVPYERIFVMYRGDEDFI